MTTLDELERLAKVEAERDRLLAQVPKWVSVEERMPDKGVRVLVSVLRSVYDDSEQELSYPPATIAQNTVGPWGFVDICGNRKRVTHWMPLPVPPGGGT